MCRALLADLPDVWIVSTEGPARIILAQGANRTFEPYDRFAQVRESAGTDAQHGLVGEQLALGAVTLRQLFATWVAHDLGPWRKRRG